VTDGLFSGVFFLIIVFCPHRFYGCDVHWNGRDLPTNGMGHLHNQFIGAGILPVSRLENVEHICKRKLPLFAE